MNLTWLAMLAIAITGLAIAIGGIGGIALEVGFLLTVLIVFRTLKGMGRLNRTSVTPVTRSLETWERVGENRSDYRAEG